VFTIGEALECRFLKKLAKNFQDWPMTGEDSNLQKETDTGWKIIEKIQLTHRHTHTNCHTHKLSLSHKLSRTDSHTHKLSDSSTQSHTHTLSLSHTNCHTHTHKRTHTHNHFLRQDRKLTFVAGLESEIQYLNALCPFYPLSILYASCVYHVVMYHVHHVNKTMFMTVVVLP